jgi:hypothetical protein
VFGILYLVFPKFSIDSAVRQRTLADEPYILKWFAIRQSTLADEQYILRRSAIRQRTLADNWALNVFLR